MVRVKSTNLAKLPPRNDTDITELLGTKRKKQEEMEIGAKTVTYELQLSEVQGRRRDTTRGIAIQESKSGQMAALDWSHEPSYTVSAHPRSVASSRSNRLQPPRRVNFKQHCDLSHRHFKINDSLPTHYDRDSENNSTIGMPVNGDDYFVSYLHLDDPFLETYPIPKTLISEHNCSED
ncbi:hypothetical protein J6590_057401 [Homalodisca vitripennis]|nr:hypothetical protein J6590_057401 [Homalodisca vitripennis]